MNHIFIGERFVEKKLINKEDVYKAIAEQKVSNEKLGEVLLRMGLISEEKYLDVVSDYLGVRYKRLHFEEIANDVKEIIPKGLMRKYTVFPVMKVGNKLSLAMVDPVDENVIKEIEKNIGVIVLPVLALRREINECIEKVTKNTDFQTHEEHLGERFIKEGMVSEEEIFNILSEQKVTHEKLGEALLRHNIINEEDYLRVLSDFLGVKAKRLTLEEIDNESRGIISIDIIKKYMIYPLKKLGNKLTVAMIDPTNKEIIEELENITNCIIIPLLALRKDIEKLIESDEEAIEKTIEEDLSKENFTEFDYLEVERVEEENKQEEKISEESAPVIKAVNSIILNAIAKRASDIHIEPEEDKVRVRYRIDGVLKEVLQLPKKISSAVSSRIKILSDLDIAEKRLPQDGRFRIKKDAKDIDFRVSVLPTSEGEKVVLRILDKSNLKLNLEDLGFEKEELEKFNKALNYPYGIILVTGPTGSGKTTTLYSALNKINSEEINIVTAEDPIEYKLKGINQVNCKSEIGYDFAAALRSFLRQDPDVIMVGEIRDAETAEIAVKASLTGHLVLSTIHTNDAPSTIQRLINMGIEPFLIASSIILVQAQRLGRRVCQNCKIEDPNKEKFVKLLGLKEDEYKNIKFYVGRGCSLCNGTGYKGRVGFYELMFINDELRELIALGKNTEEIRKCAKKFGMRTLREQAILKAVEGITSLEEVLRNTV